MAKYYSVANHIFSVRAENDFRLPANYEPFLTEYHPTRNLIFELCISNGNFPEIHEEIRQVNDEQTIICGKTNDGSPAFGFLLCGASAGFLVCSDDYSDGFLYLTDGYEKFAIDNALMIMYALATAGRKTALFHAAAINYRGKGYMFLGTSGTGKSTHALLWQRFIPGVGLVNDDNPVVRIDEAGRATVYGSPWSGKTLWYGPFN